MHLGWLLIEKRTESIFFGRFFNIRRVPQYGFHLVETALWRLLKLWTCVLLFFVLATQSLKEQACMPELEWTLQRPPWMQTHGNTEQLHRQRL